MMQAQRLDAWRAWLRSRFPELDDPHIEAAAATCEALRGVWEPLLAEPVGDDASPEPHHLPRWTDAEPT